VSDDLVKTLADLKEKEALKIVEDRINAGEAALKVLNDARKAMEIVGKRFANGEYFIPELVYSGEIMKGITNILRPKLAHAAEFKRVGKVVLGTVAGDIHDLGLNIVDFMLDVNGFEVYNLGTDVPPQKFVDKIRETGAPIVGLSGMLTLAIDSMKETVQLIKAAGLRDEVKIMIGGIPSVDDNVRKYVGADGFGRDAMAAIAMAKEWTGGKK